MAKKKHKPPEKTRGKGRKGPRTPGRLLAFLLLAAAVAVVVWLARQAGLRKPSEAQQLEAAVRQVLARLALRQATLEWEDKPLPRLVVRVFADKAFPSQRFALELEAALHNLGGHLERLPLLEQGGYGVAAYGGGLGQVGLSVLVLREKPVVPKPPEPSKKGAEGKLAIVLDDAGNSLEVLPLLDQLPDAVAVAVLPNSPHGPEVARALRQKGREVLLHMPMEPEGNGSPGPGEGALRVGMGEAEVRTLVEQALAAVGPVAGINNHMGSRATSDEPLMRALALALQGRRLYFLDSRTSPASVAEKVLRESGLPTLHRDVFLDVVDEEGAIRSALATAASLAQARGRALAIGHVHPRTLRVLASALPSLPEIRLVRPSALL